MKEMRAFFMVILMVVARLAEGGIKAFDWCWNRFLGLLPGGGGGTVMPPRHLDLPDVVEAHDAQEAAASQQRAADYLLSTPERIAQAWAQATPDHRDTIPLSLLTPDQIDWLEIHLSDEQLKIIASEKSERKVAEALTGREDVIFGVPSVGQIKRRKSDPALSDRIAAFRAGGLERPPAYMH
jgi:hypothetical protein